MTASAIVDLYGVRPCQRAWRHRGPYETVDQEGQEHGIALGLDLRLPTGDERNLLGTGAPGVSRSRPGRRTTGSFRRTSTSGISGTGRASWPAISMQVSLPISPMSAYTPSARSSHSSSRDGGPRRSRPIHHRLPRSCTAKISMRSTVARFSQHRVRHGIDQRAQQRGRA